MCGYVAASVGDSFQALTLRVARRAVLLIMFWRTRVVALCGFVGCGGGWPPGAVEGHPRWYNRLVWVCAVLWWLAARKPWKATTAGSAMAALFYVLSHHWLRSSSPAAAAQLRLRWARKLWGSGEGAETSPDPQNFKEKAFWVKIFLRLRRA